MIVKPRITVAKGFNGDVTLTVKTADKLLAKKTFTITEGALKADVLKLENPGTEKVWFEYHYSGTLSDDALTVARVLLQSDTLGLPKDSVNAGFYAEGVNSGFGMLYRGWGGFVYNASEGRYGKPIDEALLKLPEDENAKIDPLTLPFTPIGTDQMSPDRWIGQRQEIYLTATEAGTARLAEQDVVITNPLDNQVDVAGLAGDCLQGTGAAAVTQVATSKSSVTQGGAMGFTVNTAEGNATTDVTMMDMNGDGYPDIVAGGVVQYTNSQGGISGEKSQKLEKISSENSSSSKGYGGNPVASVSSIVKLIKHSPQTAANSQTKWQAQFSLSGSGSYNKDEAAVQFIDMNGDGLPDQILKNKQVRINLGYTFSDPMDWGLERIQGGESKAFNAGASGGAGGGMGEELVKGSSINKASGSFMAGFGIVSSESKEEYNLMDVNSDGLPDKVWKEGNGIKVSFNTGNAFLSPINWKGASALSESASTSESVNAAFTISINLLLPPIKISTNPGASTGHSISRPTYALQDVDGDGYLDIVESEKESELKVTRSAIGRTNMLKAVTNSLGGTFTLDYAHTAPTYGLPGGKWVMSSLTVDDGIHDDGPLMTTAFEYKDGKRDRHEREFLGFGEVITRNLDTEKENALYRKSVQKYDVSGYYTQGNLVNASVEDAAGKVYTETHNEYDGYYLTAKGDEYTFTAQPVLCSDRASAFVPLRYTANLQYEGTAQGMITSEAWNEYYLTGHHGELKSYRFSNKGKLGSKGDGKFDYQTSIRYTSNSSRNILGLPTDVTVTGGDGKVYHQVSAVYDTKYPNHLTRITQQLGNGEAVTDYRYDSFGNILQKTLPANAKGQRMWYKYRYEPEMNMYVERVEDAFGYRSEAGNFDYRYGIAKERRDLNNFYYETDVDDLGRITGVRGPNELATGIPYIIAFEYSPKAEFTANGITAPAYAVTKHYDIQHPNDDMETVTFVDGFGRPVQVKKDGVVTSASEGSVSDAQNVMIVSGRNVYDAFGRVAKAYYPVTEELGKRTDFNKAFDGVSPTVTVYDVLDRATEVTLPDESKTLTAYTTDAGSRALVTTVTDALGNKQATYTNGSSKTVMTKQLSGPDGEITTTFEYDGIDRLVRVIDTEGNVTTSVYDMGDRRTEVNHPASGITTFTYDALGNVLTKQTANLAKEGKSITYDYDYHRLTGINYPDHPENNVKYYYGGRNASQNRIGRLMLREDGTGAIEYFYGKMGEVTKTRRTLIVPNQAIATYVTQWTYDSHNRLLEMIYPDEEKVTYSYNLGGQLEKVRGYKSYGYDYVNRIGYDKFEQRTYLKYCNGAETFYTYEPARRRLQNLTVNAGGKSIMDNAYAYDAVSNVLSVANKAALPESGKAGGQMAHAYTYDALYRLASATGTYAGADSKTASYRLEMSYDNMHRIVSKKQHLTQQGVQFDGTLHVGYDLAYTYGKTEGRKFQLAEVKDANYCTEENPDSVAKVDNNHTYTYDANGNLVYVNTGRIKQDGTLDSTAAERKLRWDEENRLTASDDNGFVTNYWYDADGERTVKTSGEGEQLYVNSEFAGGRTNTAKFSLYVSPYLVANQGGRYTKHIYIGSQRIVSKIGDFASYGSDPRRIQYAGSETDGLSVNYKQKYSAQQQVIKDNYAIFEVPYNGTDNNDYVDGQGFCCDDGSPEAAQARALALENNFQDPDAYEKLQFYYHPDHLGSSSYITNLDGEVVQHIEYVPFGEVFIEERNSIWNTPYLFNAKEFDEETGLYYYGARYYDPRLSLWISTDAKQEENLNVSTYIYTFNNPIKYQDPDGNLPIETIWDATNLSLGINSFIGNIKKGSLGAALVDGVGIIADAAATALPYIPGGASSAIKAYRAGKTASKTTLKAGSKAPSKIMDAASKEFPSRRAAFRQAKRDAGIPTSKNFSTHVKGDAAKSGDSGRRGIEYTFDTEGAYGSQFNRSL
ncbi:RHS repeat domain-containing protein [Bacteroides finegoldii]|uniref:RHS repeat domain-containing protein n=1 Tax=Bacteroides finegoldii TaxID=338188 RepID=UPI00374396FA